MANIVAVWLIGWSHGELWPTGWMDEDAIWHGVGLGQGHSH